MSPQRVQRANRRRRTEHQHQLCLASLAIHLWHPQGSTKKTWRSLFFCLYSDKKKKKIFYTLSPIIQVIYFSSNYLLFKILSPLLQIISSFKSYLLFYNIIFPLKLYLLFYSVSPLLQLISSLTLYLCSITV